MNIEVRSQLPRLPPARALYPIRASARSHDTFTFSPPNFPSTTKLSFSTATKTSSLSPSSFNCVPPSYLYPQIQDQEPASRCTLRLLLLRLRFSSVLLLPSRTALPLLISARSISAPRVRPLHELYICSFTCLSLNANHPLASWCNAEYDSCNFLCGNPKANSCDNVRFLPPLRSIR